MTLKYTDPTRFLPTATYTVLAPYFLETARVTALDNMEEVDKAILRVTGMAETRNSPNTMKERLLQKDLRRLSEDVDGNPDGTDSTYHDLLLTPTREEGGAPYRLAMVDSDYIHNIAVSRGYTPVPYIGSTVIPEEIQHTVAAALSAYVGGYDSVLWEVNIDDGGWTTDEFDDETILEPEITIASGTEAVIRLTVTNDFGTDVYEQTVTLTA